MYKVCCRAARCCCLSPPRRRAQGLPAFVAALPGMHEFLTRGLTDAAAAAALWPRRLVLPVLPGIDTAGLLPPPAGVLRVRVVAATDLQPPELTGLPPGVVFTEGLSPTRNPYVELELPGLGSLGTTARGRRPQRERTSHRSRTAAPEFEEEFLFLLEDPALQTLKARHSAAPPRWCASALLARRSRLSGVARSLSRPAGGCEVLGAADDGGGACLDGGGVGAARESRARRSGRAPVAAVRCRPSQRGRQGESAAALAAPPARAALPSRVAYLSR